MGSASSRPSSADSDSPSNASTRPTSHSSSNSSGNVLGPETKTNPEASPVDEKKKSHITSKRLSKIWRRKPRQANNMDNRQAHNADPWAHEVIDLSSDNDVEGQIPSPASSGLYSDSERGRDFADALERVDHNDIPDPQRHDQRHLHFQGPAGPPNDNLGGFYDLPDVQPALQAPQANVQQNPEAFIQGELYDLPHRGERPGPNPNEIPWSIEDEDLDLQRFLHDQAAALPPVRPSQVPLAAPGEENNAQQIPETRLKCIDTVVALFPGICRDYVSELYDTIAPSSDQLIAHILDKQEKGTPWPKAKEKLNSLKRKRVVDEQEEAMEESIRKYTAADRRVAVGAQGYVRRCLQEEFTFTPMNFINSVMTQNKDHLFPAYRVLEEAERTWNNARPPYNKLKNRRVLQRPYLDRNAPGKLEEYLTSILVDPSEREVLTELQAAREIRQKADKQRQAERQVEIDENLNVLKAQAEGTMSECGCCFGDFPLNRMVHCNNEEVMHWFCKGCTKQTAENEIGNSKYELHCMSMDGCTAGFANDQRTLFLDEKTFIALERNEQEAMLRMAGIENLASCPFCPYAAEYPPVEVNREFRCAAPDCEKVSCRLCKLESHIPKSCEENAKDNGLSVRRQIEEAMSAALIRTCNKCGTPFVKEEGCNKMTCTRNGCYNVQCYVCSKSCGYDHFDDRARGGKTGNCPLFESVEQRHDDEVQKAEKEALARVRAEHPEYTEADLRIKMSENVANDDQRRKENDSRGRLAPGANGLYRGYPLGMGHWHHHPGHPHRDRHVQGNDLLQEFPQFLEAPPLQGLLDVANGILNNDLRNRPGAQVVNDPVPDAAAPMREQFLLRQRYLEEQAARLRRLVADAPPLPLDPQEDAAVLAARRLAIPPRGDLKPQEDARPPGRRDFLGVLNRLRRPRVGVDEVGPGRAVQVDRDENEAVAEATRIQQEVENRPRQHRRYKPLDPLGARHHRHIPAGRAEAPVELPQMRDGELAQLQGQLQPRNEAQREGPAPKQNDPFGLRDFQPFPPANGPDFQERRPGPARGLPLDVVQNLPAQYQAILGGHPDGELQRVVREQLEQARNRAAANMDRLNQEARLLQEMLERRNLQRPAVQEEQGNRGIGRGIFDNRAFRMRQNGGGDQA